MKLFLFSLSFCLLSYVSLSQESYVVNSTEFSYEVLTDPQSVSLSDDEVSSPIFIGFPFTFSGQDYNYVYFSSNGFITFEAGSNGCCSGQDIPNPSSPNGVIAAFWEDLNPSRGGTIQYQVLGTAPNQVFVVQYEDVPHYNSPGDLASFQIKLFEGSDLIEIHCEDCNSDGGSHTQGVEDTRGINGTTLPGRKRADFSLAEDAVQFARFYAESTENQVTLSWSDIFNETGYTLQRSVDAEPFVDVATLAPNTTTYVDTGLDVDQEYLYRLVVTLEEENTLPIDIRVWTSPRGPSELTATALDPVTVELNWTDNASSEAGYVIERSLEPSANFEVLSIESNNSSTYEDVTAFPFTTYYYRVYAFNEGNNSPFDDAFVTTPAASRHFVDIDATGSGSGTSWQNAYQNLQEAISAAGNGDEIWVAEGVYRPTGSNPVFTLFTPGLKIYGGFSGNESDISERDIAAHTTTLSGDIGVAGDPSDNARRVIYHETPSRYINTFTTLNGITIEDAVSDTQRGGGIFNDGSLRLESVSFLDNTADQGGGVFSEGPALEIVECTFQNNYVLEMGGAVSVEDGTLTITNSKFIANTAEGEGGAVHFETESQPSMTISIQNSEFSGNASGEAAGALYFGIDGNESHEISIVDSKISDNAAGGSAAGVYFANGRLDITILNSTIDNNTTVDRGGAMVLDTDGLSTIYNTTISGNEADQEAGGLDVQAGYVSLKHVTIFNNTGGSGTGGINVGTNSIVTLENTIIAGNNDDGSGYEDIEGQLVSEGHNLVGNIGLQAFDENTQGDIYGDTEETSEANEGAIRRTNEAVDPLLAALADNGGTTFTHALQGNSPARNAGANSDIALDQRGRVRIGRPDIGSFEFNAPSMIDQGIPDQVAFQLQAFSFTIPSDAFDAGDEGDVLTYQVSQADDSELPAWLTFDETTTQFSGTPGLDDTRVTIKVTVTDKHMETLSDEFEIAMSVITSLDGRDKNSLKIYPNPVEDVLNVRIPDVQGADEVHVKISTIGGLISSQYTLFSPSRDIKLETSGLERGVYLLELSTRTSKYQYKIIKK